MKTSLWIVLAFMVMLAIHYSGIAYDKTAMENSMEWKKPFAIYGGITLLTGAILFFKYKNK